MYTVGGDVCICEYGGLRSPEEGGALLELEMPDRVLGTESMASAKGSACS